jgi:hypothetical protein
MAEKRNEHAIALLKLMLRQLSVDTRVRAIGAGPVADALRLAIDELESRQRDIVEAVLAIDERLDCLLEHDSHLVYRLRSYL